MRQWISAEFALGREADPWQERKENNPSAGGGNRKSPLTKLAKAVAKPVEAAPQRTRLMTTIAKQLKEDKGEEAEAGKVVAQKS